RKSLTDASAWIAGRDRRTARFSVESEFPGVRQGNAVCCLPNRFHGRDPLPLEVKTMDFLTRADLKDLLAIEETCVSAFMPTWRAGRETLQGPVRLKNLLRRAEDVLKGKGVAA